MGRYRSNFTLFKRMTKTRGFVWYYKTYKPDGSKTIKRSTFCTSKVQARLYCEKLYKEGFLYSGDTTVFEIYAKDFFSENGSYAREVLSKERMIARTLKHKRGIFNTHVLPYFSGKRIGSITTKTVDDFQMFLKNEGFSFSTIKSSLTVLKDVLRYALRDGSIQKDPFIGFTWVKNNTKERDAFTLDEVKKVLIALSYNAQKPFLVGIMTGMRLGEICAIRRTTFVNGYLNVVDQKRQDRTLDKTKTKKERQVVVPQEFYEYLQNNFENEFYTDIQPSTISDWIKVAVEKNIGNCKERLLSFHSSRHFFITYCLSKRPDLGIKVATITGHKAGISAIQARYTNFKPSDFNEIVEIQTELWNEIKPYIKNM